MTAQRAPREIAATSMRPITLRLACEEMIGGGRHRIEHPGYDPDVPGLGICMSLHCDEQWQVIHVRSGRVVADHLPTSEAAAGLARRLGSVADWTQPRGRIRRGRERLRRVFDLLVAMAALPQPAGQRAEEEA